MRDTELVIVSGDLTNFGGVDDARQSHHESPRNVLRCLRSGNLVSAR